LRDEYPKVKAAGAEVVAVGTGSASYARAFAEDDRIPFPVLVDDDATAARAATVERVGLLGLFHPDSFAETRRAWQAGYRIGRPGKRTNQLGASFVVGPGNALQYEYRDRHTADHAPIADLLAALAV
jgi:peroxiredoxin